jgi:hypothetical protein
MDHVETLLLSPAEKQDCPKAVGSNNPTRYSAQILQHDQ